MSEGFRALGLDHVNLRTARLDEMVAWYRRALGLEPGWRPDFPFPGAWLYVNGRPALHLVGIEREAPAPEAPRLEHFALSAAGLGAFLERLRAEGVAWRIGRPPGAGIVQVNLHDPDGTHIHIDFPEAEAAGLAL